jgi:hypothetical protein
VAAPFFLRHDGGPYPAKSDPVTRKKILRAKKALKQRDFCCQAVAFCAINEKPSAFGDF